MQLIPRLYDCDEGEVLVDGVNVKEYSLNHLRDGVAMVLQKNTLFSGSIMENLRWGDEEATDEQVKEAAKAAQADGFVSAQMDMTVNLDRVVSMFPVDKNSVFVLQEHCLKNRKSLF